MKRFAIFVLVLSVVRTIYSPRASAERQDAGQGCGQETGFGGCKEVGKKDEKKDKDKDRGNCKGGAQECPPNRRRRRAG